MDVLGPRSRFLEMLVLTALLALPLLAQEGQGIVTGLHARGSTGFTLDRSSSGYFTTQGLGEEVNAELQGAIVNPNFISFSNSLSFGNSTANINSYSLGNDQMIGGSATALLLPSSFYPFTFTWQRTRVDLGETGIATTTNDDRLGFDWRLQMPNVPKLAVRYERDSMSSDVPVGTFATANSQSTGWNIAASDTWKGWEWNAGWMRSDSQSQQLLLNLPINLDQQYSLIGANLKKMYLGDKGTFNYSFSRDDETGNFGDIAGSSGILTTHSAMTMYRFTSKLTGTGMFQYYSYDTRGQFINNNDLTQPTTIIAFPMSGYAGNGGLMYQINPHISISDMMGYSTASAADSNVETIQSFLTNYPAINTNFSWKRIRFTTSYGLGYTQMQTNFGHTFDAWGNNGSVGATWANPWVTVSGNFGITHATNQTMAGSYTDSLGYGASAETTKLRRLGTVRFRYQWLDQNMLGSTGYVQGGQSAWTISLLKRKWQIDAGGSRNTGAHQLFGYPSNPFQPLPPLVGVPLIDDTIHSYFVMGTLRLRQNLNIHGTYRRDINDIFVTGGSSDYSLYEIYADYRIGKMVMEASYGHYLSVSNVAGSSWGAPTDRLRLRIVRTFNWF